MDDVGSTQIGYIADNSVFVSSNLVVKEDSLKNSRLAASIERTVS